MSTKLTARAQLIRQVIYAFIKQRLETKIEKLEPEDEKYQAEQEKHQPLVWLESAVARSAQIQVVTHPLKSTYPHAHIRETTSLYCRPADLPQHNLVATQSLGDGFIDDVTGNAAALDVYALLQQEYEGETLLQLCLNQDADFQMALHDDEVIAKQWSEALAEVTQPKMKGVASHTNAKQLYWLSGSDPYDDQGYTMLAPLHSSSLAQHVFEQIDTDRFSKEAAEIRAAVREKRAHDGVARSYPDLAIQVIGGSNPQGISALSSKRRGVNYLLSSQPPSWKSSGLRLPLNIDSIFSLFEKQRGFICNPHYWLESLKSFLAEDPPPNRATRARVQGLVQGLLDELYLFALNYQELSAGWSADAQCQLPLAQQCWLDPGRALVDSNFAEYWLNSDWDEQIERAFSRWLNTQLGRKVEYLGDVEFRRWVKQMRNDNEWATQIGNSQKAMLNALRKGETDGSTT